MPHINKSPLAPGLPVHRDTGALYDARLGRMHYTPAQILRMNFNRAPLRCDEGEVTVDLAAAQARAARVLPLQRSAA